MELTHAYKGNEFPLYAYKSPVLTVEVAASKEATEGKWLILPMPNTMLQHYAERIGLRADAEIIDVDSHLPDKMNKVIEVCQDSLFELNRLCQAVEHLNATDIDKLTAVAVMTKAIGANEYEQLILNLDSFEFIPNVKDPEEYGRYMIQESGRFEYDPNLEDYYDYTAYANNRIAEYQGQFTSLGYVAYVGAMPLEELLHSDPKEQPFQMGGMNM